MHETYNMKFEQYGIAALTFIIIILFGMYAVVSAAAETTVPQRFTTPIFEIATEEELQIAKAEWEQSAHSKTYDNGFGANTTCARCKSPQNWDPSIKIAAEMALDCGSCKRVPGEQRPLLSGGIPVLEDDWQNIQCSICHIPVDGSYYTEIAFWNQELNVYEEVENTHELCEKCHEGQHGFEVIEEQLESSVHIGMECVECHGNHGSESDCRDCHTPLGENQAADEHNRHPSVNCTACHDAGGLSIWLEKDPDSKHFGQYITRRFGHTLTSWPSHNLSMEIECGRCHHPTNLGGQTSAIVPYLDCDICHQYENGAVSIWCEFFHRNKSPYSIKDLDFLEGKFDK
jgi:hypothetical protein